MNSIERKLSKEISQAAGQIARASHAAAVLALDEAFGLQKPVARPNTTSSSNRAMPGRRCPAELADQRKALLEAVCRSPGIAMTELARLLDSTPKQLHLPMAGLKEDKRVKSVGQRNSTRYFPLGQ